MKTVTIVGMAFAAGLATNLRAADTAMDAQGAERLVREPCDGRPCIAKVGSAQASVREAIMVGVDYAVERGAIGSDAASYSATIPHVPLLAIANQPESNERAGSPVQVQPSGTSDSLSDLRGGESQISGASDSAPTAPGSNQAQVLAANLRGAGNTSMGMQPVSSTAVLFGLQSTIGSWTEQYEYDAAGRLRKVTFANGAITNYTLDNAGNRTNVSSTP